MAGTIYGECELLVNESEGFGITTVAPNASGGLDITTQPPVFTTVSGDISISGNWPNLVITDAGAGGGGAPVYTFNGGAGISVSGGPFDFTFSLSPTGIIAGDYGPVTFNTFGQAIAVGQILSSVTGTNGVNATVDPQTGAVTLVMDTATNSTPGVTTLYTTLGSQPYPDDRAATPSAVQQMIDIELAALAGGDSTVELFFSPTPAAIDGTSLANSTLLAVTQLVNVAPGSILSVTGQVKLTVPLDCMIVVMERNAVDRFLAVSPRFTGDLFTFYGAIPGLFASQLEVRAYRPGAVAPVAAVSEFVSLMVS